MRPQQSGISRPGRHTVLVLAAGVALYALVRDPVPLVGSSPILDVGWAWWWGSLPSAVFGAAVASGLAWAMGPVPAVRWAAVSLGVAGGIELSQAEFGVWGGWGTYDGADLALTVAAVIGVLALSLRRNRPLATRPSRSSRTWRVAAVAIVAAASAGASSIDSLFGDIFIDVLVIGFLEFTDTEVQYVDANTRLIIVTVETTPFTAERISMDLPDEHGLGHSYVPGFCSVEFTSVATCEFTGTRYTSGPFGTGVDHVDVEATAVIPTPSGVDEYVIEQEVVVDYTTGPPETDTPAGSEPLCDQVNPQPSGFVLGHGSLEDGLVVDSYPSSGYTFTGRTVELTADGSGSLLVSLVVEGSEHDPCSDGSIDHLSFRIAAGGREGDRGNVAVRPALFVEDSVYVASPLTVASGEGGDETFELTADDFTRVGGTGTLDLSAGPPVRFGLVVGVSCPATSVCGEVDRAVTVTTLEVGINGSL